MFSYKDPLVNLNVNLTVSFVLAAVLTAFLAPSFERVWLTIAVTICIDAIFTSVFHILLHYFANKKLGRNLFREQVDMHLHRFVLGPIFYVLSSAFQLVFLLFSSHTVAILWSYGISIILVRFGHTWYLKKIHYFD